MRGVTGASKWLMHLTPYVLVGGRSIRMGRDKAFLPWRGQTLLQHTVSRLAPFGLARLLSGDAQDLERARQLAPFGALVPDRTPGAGPLGGVDAALHDAATEWLLVVPVDQPLLPATELLDWARRIVTLPVDASWLVSPSGPEALPLLLQRSLAPAVAQALAAGERRLLPTIQSAAQNGLPVAVANPDWFTNLNRPEDLEYPGYADRVD